MLLLYRGALHGTTHQYYEEKIRSSLALMG